MRLPFFRGSRSIIPLNGERILVLASLISAAVASAWPILIFERAISTFASAKSNSVLATTFLSTSNFTRSSSTSVDRVSASALAMLAFARLSSALILHRWFWKRSWPLFTNFPSSTKISSRYPSTRARISTFWKGLNISYIFQRNVDVPGDTSTTGIPQALIQPLSLRNGYIPRGQGAWGGSSQWEIYSFRKSGKVDAWISRNIIIRFDCGKHLKIYPVPKYRPSWRIHHQTVLFIQFDFMKFRGLLRNGVIW